MGLSGRAGPTASITARIERGQVPGGLISEYRTAAWRAHRSRSAAISKSWHGTGTSCGSSSSPPAKPDISQGKGAPGRAQLYVDGRLAGQSEFPVATPLAVYPGGLSCGANPGSPVTPGQRAPFRFTGTLPTVTLDLSGDLITDSEAGMRIAIARQ